MKLSERLKHWILCRFGKHETRMFSNSYRHGIIIGMHCIHCGTITEGASATTEELEEDGIMAGEKWHQ